jgi:hypothetical protein
VDTGSNLGTGDIGGYAIGGYAIGGCAIGTQAIAPYSGQQRKIFSKNEDVTMEEESEEWMALEPRQGSAIWAPLQKLGGKRS